MTKLAVAISMLFGLLSALAGCARPLSERQAPPEQAHEPAAPMVLTETDASGPAEAVPAVPALPAEPNEGLAASHLPPPTSHLQVAEPDEAVPALPAEPNEGLATSHLPLPTSHLQDTGPEGLASFYREYADILQEYVNKDGRVDYDSLRRRRVMMRDLLILANGVDPNVYPQWPQEEKLAFWIDVYNLKMLDIIARNYPIQSSWWLRLTWPPSDIRHIDGIWSKYRFIVMDEEFTLGEVEQRFFRKAFGDPRAFLAITYASRSGPPLRRTPYGADDLDRQLDEQARTFLTEGRGVRIARNKGAVYLSALFKPTWRGKEFVARYGTDKKFKDRLPETRAVLNFITRYLPPDDVYFLEVENYSLEYVNYDWRLNDVGS
jgi:hypothetical protein